jgi:hypothetical protein
LFRLIRQPQIYRREYKHDERVGFVVKDSLAGDSCFYGPKWALSNSLIGQKPNAKILAKLEAVMHRPVAQETDVITASINHGLSLTGGKAGAKVWQLPQ